MDKFLEKGNLKTHLTLTQIGLGVAHVLQQYVVEPVLFEWNGQISYLGLQAVIAYLSRRTHLPPPSTDTAAANQPLPLPLVP